MSCAASSTSCRTRRCLQPSPTGAATYARLKTAPGRRRSSAQGTPARPERHGELTSCLQKASAVRDSLRHRPPRGRRALRRSRPPHMYRTLHRSAPRAPKAPGSRNCVGRGGYLIGREAGARVEAVFLRSMAEGDFEIVDLTRDDYGRMADLVVQYGDLPLGTTDASVIAIAERLNIAEVATLDHRHFTVV